MADSDKEAVFPLYQEVLTTKTRTVETGQVDVHVRTQENEYTFQDVLKSQVVNIDRKSIERFVDEAPTIRQEGEVTIVPVVEERWVKRFFLKEEVRITRTEQNTPYVETVTLQHQDVVIERTGPQ